MTPTTEQIKEAAESHAKQTHYRKDGSFFLSDRDHFAAGAIWMQQQLTQPAPKHGVGEPETGQYGEYWPTVVIDPVPGGMLAARPEETKLDNL